MKDMKLVLETWRKYSAEINENSNAGAVYLFENKKPVKTEFSVLLENYDNGSLTTDQLIETWEKSFDYELSLLEEGMMDKISDWVHTKRKRGRPQSSPILRWYGSQIQKETSKNF